ncbi:AraC family transcriptional regulator [Pontiella agarivorans]|uniref:AraC family transcriptional regulator n=1 Tax=Pontiella agarivorans TaxID=3038953 RepID=A0ABU5MVG7_9BACT|nr:AraC family transcriptional regulator [Pontiella agarivorans]MDZ8118155.1 AraC family transcriptional regulator [Pontiella agarivorans]
MKKNVTFNESAKRPFEAPVAYDMPVSGARLRGHHVRVRAGIKLHEAELLPDARCSFTVAFGADSVWLGYVRRGTKTVQLPDLGRISVKAGEWFIARVEEMQLLAEKEADVELMSFSMCPHVMGSLVDLCRTDTAEKLHCFACMNQHKPTVLHGKAGQKLQWLSEQISIASASDLKGRMELEARSLEWISELVNQPSLAEKDKKEFGCSTHDAEALRNVAAYLEAHLEEEHSLADLCRRFYINEFKLKRNFKAMYGITVFGYLRELRFQRAEQLLKKGELSVIEIANEVGYSNPSHFARGFQERFGMKPKAFQNMHQAGE